MFNKSNFCHIASNNRNEQKGSVFIYKTTDTLAQVTQSGYFNEKLIDINLHDLIIHVQYDPVARTLKKSVLIVTERTMDNVETAPILDQTIGDDIADLGDQVQGIEEKIPGAASAANQLADKAFVNAIKTAIESTIAEINQDIDSLQETKQDKATALDHDDITNCLTKIPQNIKLVRDGGTITIKAGSVVHRAYGNLDTTYTFTSDTTLTPTYNGQYYLIPYGSSMFLAHIDGTSSSVIANRPTSISVGTGAFFATDENKIYITSNSGATWTDASSLSLPIAVITVANGALSSIDHIFNGFGFIGSTVFVLPGVKGLVPNGRNEDGTLKNISTTTSSVAIKAYHGTNSNLYVGFIGTNVYFQSVSSVSYNSFANTTSWGVCIIARMSATGGKTTSFEPKTAFHAVDYNDFESLSETVATNNDNALHKTGNETATGVKTLQEIRVGTTDTGNNLRIFQLANGDIRIVKCNSSDIDYGDAFMNITNNGLLLQSEVRNMQIGARNPATSDLLALNLNVAGGNFALGSTSVGVLQGVNKNLLWVGNPVVTTTEKSLAQNGYVILNNGLIIQWGSQSITTTDNHNQTISFPTAFTTTNYTIVKNYPTTSSAAAQYRELCFFDLTTAGATTNCNGSAASKFYWLAIGY